MEGHKWRTGFAAASVVKMALRIFYAAGPGDVANTFRNWKDGRDDPSQVSMTYSGQFFDVCRALEAKALVMSHSARADHIDDGQFTIVHRAKPFRNRGGVFYHLAELIYGLHVVAAAVRFRADFAIVNEGVTHWFVLSLLSLFRIKLVPAIHCVLWPKFKQPNRAQRVFNRLNRIIFKRVSFAIMSASEDISNQVREVAAGKARPIIEFLPTYRRDTFSEVGPPTGKSPFHVLFAGRIERNKGVFDLLDVARRFKQESRDGIFFDACGTGSVLDDLKLEVKAAGVEDSFLCHGYCNRAEMQAMLGRSHVVVVPTTSDFVEGFNQVVVEAVLARRPVITSSVCPALSYVRDAIVEVAPDDRLGYGDAILKLFEDVEFFDKKRHACTEYQSQFYDLDRSWGAALRRIIESANGEMRP